MYINFTGKNGRKIRGEVIQDELSLKRLVKKMRNLEEFAYDTETTSLEAQWKGKMEIVGISISWGGVNNYYVPMGHVFDNNQLPVKTVVKYLRPIFEREDVRIIGWNLKYDIHVLACYDINIKTKDLFDGMVASWIIDENELKGLKPTTSAIYGVKQESFDACLTTITKEERKEYGYTGNKKPPFKLVRIAVGAPYAIADAYWTWRHYVDWQLDTLETEKMETHFYKMMMPFMDTIYKMERRGVRMNRDRLLEMQKKAEKDLADLEYQIVEVAGIAFKVSSDQQLAELLFGYKKFNKKGEYSGNIKLVEKSFGFPVQGVTDGGAPQTNKESLKALTKLTYKKDKRKLEGIKMVKLILKYKKLEKLKSAFIDGLLEQIYEDGKVHCTMTVGGTTSGRISCSRPNMNQLPRPVEMPKEPVRDKYDSEEAYIKATKKYKKDKEEAEFWKFYEIRDAIIPDSDDDCIIAGDFSNLEMVILGHFSKDPMLVETFENRHDAHGSTAVNMFNLDCTADEAKKKYPALRQISKTINFGYIRLK